MGYNGVSDRQLFRQAGFHIDARALLIDQDAMNGDFIGQHQYETLFKSMVCQRDAKECQRKVVGVEPLNVHFVTMTKELPEWSVLNGATGVQFVDV